MNTNTTPVKSYPSGCATENFPETGNSLSTCQQIIPKIIQLTEYYQGRISQDINDMAGHIINTLNNSSDENAQLEAVYEELEKYKSLIKIQQSVIHITNLITNSHFNW